MNLIFSCKLIKKISYIELICSGLNLNLRSSFEVQKSDWLYSLESVRFKICNILVANDVTWSAVQEAGTQIPIFKDFDELEIKDYWIIYYSL